MKKIITFALIISLFATHAFAVDIPAEAGVLMEKDTGKILYEKESHAKLPPASVTKVMTLLLVCEALDEGRISLTDTVTTSAHAASMGGSQVFLEEGEKMPLEDMLKATVISSGNDSAVALAEHIAGSEDGFVELMNKRAKELGMNDTHFANCTGLDADGHLTSAHDIAIMSCELLKHDFIKKYTTTWMDSIRNGEFQLSNTNKLIKTYNGITGLKTGSTGNAKYCVSASAERNGMELVAAIMSAPTTAERFSSASTLLDYGFANYGLFDAKKDFQSVKIPVVLGATPQVEGVLSDSGKVLINKSDLSKVKTETEICENVTAPVKAGQKLGSMKIYCGDALISEIPIIANSEVERKTYSNIFWQLISIAFMR
ncbi:MAG: D-alanyl-D-alanine carboxypeptidase [Clostridia bacterium]|nr:D-alanyl-D-alanine carboxypeptidase [Clostridia bacterium]